MSATSSPDEIRIIHGPNALATAKSVWETLEKRPEVTPFQCFSWAEAWHRHLAPHAEPWVLLVGDPVVSLLPMARIRIGGVRILRFAGHGISDYAGVLPVDPGPEVIRQIGSRLRRESGVDLLQLQALTATQSTRVALSTSLGIRYLERTYEICPQVSTTSPWDEYLANRSRKQRANIKRAHKRTHAYGAVSIAHQAADDSLFEEMLAVERESWKWDQGSAYLQARRRKAFLYDVLVRSKLAHEVWSLRIDGVLAAFAVVFLKGEVRYYYLPSFRKRFADSGSLLLAELIRDSCESSTRAVDLLQGDEAYKKAWATEERQVHELCSAITPLAGGGALCAIHLRWTLARYGIFRQWRAGASRLRARWRN